MARDEGCGRWRALVLALMVLFLLALAGEALAPAVKAAERARDRGRRGPGVTAARLARAEAFRAQSRRGDVEAEVVGGQPVAPGTFTFMTVVLIDVGGSDVLRCGGSLIDPRYVLTAAHCVEDLNGTLLEPDGFALVIGRALLPETGNGTVRGVVAVTPHPQWNPETRENDVAVLELDVPVPVSIANPLPLVGAGETPFDAAGQPVTVAGWGTTSFRGPVANRLRSANLTIVSDASCGAAYGDDFEQAVMICAASRGRDACQGDSGGPLFAREVIGFDVKKTKTRKGKKRKTVRTPIYRDTQVGIVSFGTGCAEPGFPGVYTRLSAPGISDFIVEVVN